MPINFHLDVNKNPPEVQVKDSTVPEARPFAQYSSKHTAIINDTPLSFNTVEDKFNALVADWRRLRESGSSTDTMINDAYGQIVAMSWSAVPFLLREVERQSGHWFTALKWITGQEVVKPEMRGDIRAMRRAWIEWGKQCKALKKPQEDAGSEIIFQTFPSTAVILQVGPHGTTTVLDSSSVITSGGIGKNVTSTIGLMGQSGLHSSRNTSKP